MTSSHWDVSDFAPHQLARPHRSTNNGPLGVVAEWTLGAGEAMGGLYSSVEDMARFVAFELGAWPASSAPASELLRRATLRDSQRTQWVSRLSVRTKSTHTNPQRGHSERSNTTRSDTTRSDTTLVNTKSQLPSARVKGKGFGWSTSQSCRFAHLAWHNGGTEGHSSVIALLPDRGVGVIVLANGYSAAVDAAAIGLLRDLHDAGVLPEREAPATLNGSLRRKTDALLATVSPLSTERHQEFFAPRLGEILSVEVLDEMLNNLRAEYGQCRTGAAFQTYHRIWQAAVLLCEKGPSDIVVEVALQENRFIGFSLRPLDKALERQAEHRARIHPDACQVESSLGASL